MSDLCLHVQTLDNEYTVVEWSDGKLEALRNGQWWRDYTGDALVLQLAKDVNELRVENADLQLQLDAPCNAEELRQVRADNAALRLLLREAITEHVDPYDLPEGDDYIARVKTALGEYQP